MSVDVNSDERGYARINARILNQRMHTDIGSCRENDGHHRIWRHWASLWEGGEGLPDAHHRAAP